MEEWRDVVGFEGRYEVSNLGNVRTSFNSPHKNARIHRGKTLKSRRSGDYARVSLNKNGVKSSPNVHVLVLEAFHGPRPCGKVARHIDGNSGNNSASNLMWSTQKENIADKKIHGTYKFGENHQNAVLTERDVIAIRKMATDGITKAEIARTFLVTPTNIGYIVRRKSWIHI